ncbi:MAG: hypothetical protein GTN38_03190 [Candidatus Aenigmarchaeota archaeon]|nr:hypothetical protein [Candidatus Aenigmarchaeota archaeon]NIP40666.1 hypothetical protein [Candidatus Aenigmarchaeota archaeon]NIQ18472.1 hypothetical protein [Candidatus Aenigmarchaeota archaeon]NIS73371.1 hypothetical protein [Candidatus Aenigmarchaeota archaeon]
MVENYDFEKMLRDILKERPVSVDTISAITGYPSNYIIMKLRRLQKWNEVKPVTKKEVTFWALCNGQEVS